MFTVSLTEIFLLPMVIFVLPGFVATLIGRYYPVSLKILFVILSIVLSWFGLLIVVSMALAWRHERQIN